MKTTKWINFDWYTHEPQTYTGENFAKFVRDFRSDVRRLIKPSGWEVHNLRGNHYYVSGFLFHPELNKYLFLSTSDVRYFPESWNDHVSLTVVKNDHDFTGGATNGTTLPNIGMCVERMREWN